MISEACEIGLKVRINEPGHLLHGVLGTVVDREASDEATVRFDVYLPMYDDYEDTRRGAVCVDPKNLEPI